MENFIMDSTAIRQIQYEPTTEALKVTFTSGHSYDYPNVPHDLIKKWVKAESAGKFFNAYIKQYGR